MIDLCPISADPWLVGASALLAMAGAVGRQRTRASFTKLPIDPALPPQPAASDPRRTDDVSLAILGARLVENRRRAAARTRLGEDLALLDRRSWHVERDVIVAGVTLPFVVFGPCGLFALTSSHGWTMSDLTILDGAATQLAAVLPMYPDPVRAGIYLPYDAAAPRSWFNELGAGGWIVGGGHLLEFLE